MRVTVAAGLEEAGRHRLEGAVCAVFDVLRATSTAVAALAGGAEAVWPCLDEEEARVLAARLAGAGRPVLLAGERDSLPVPGFDLGNSPPPLAEGVAAGRHVILATTNGTRAIRAAAEAGAAVVVAGALVNAAAVARRLAEAGGERVVLLCAGTQGRFALEDWLGAGAVVAELAALAPRGLAADDAALAARAAFLGLRDSLAEALLTGAHGSRLAGLGLARDVGWSARLSVVDAVPILTDGALRRWEDAGGGREGARFQPAGHPGRHGAVGGLSG